MIKSGRLFWEELIQVWSDPPRIRVLVLLQNVFEVGWSGNVVGDEQCLSLPILAGGSASATSVQCV